MSVNSWFRCTINRADTLFSGAKVRNPLPTNCANAPNVTRAESRGILPRFTPAGLEAFPKFEWRFQNLYQLGISQSAIKLEHCGDQKARK